MRGEMVGENGWLRYDGGCIGKENETQVSKKRKKIKRTQRRERVNSAIFLYSIDLLGLT